MVIVDITIRHHGYFNNVNTFSFGSSARCRHHLSGHMQHMLMAGLAAQRLNWLEGCTQVYAIPVSASSKNPFFARHAGGISTMTTIQSLRLFVGTY